jgi:hypothetical protein
MKKVILLLALLFAVAYADGNRFGMGFGDWFLVNFIELPCQMFVQGFAAWWGSILAFFGGDLDFYMTHAMKFHNGKIALPSAQLYSFDYTPMN